MLVQVMVRQPVLKNWEDLHTFIEMKQLPRVRFEKAKDDPIHTPAWSFKMINTFLCSV